jgi:hypothetical protein
MLGKVDTKPDREHDEAPNDTMSIAEFREFVENSPWGTFVEPDPNAPSTIIFGGRRSTPPENDE